ncbi:MAG: hypothetical protein KDA96_14360 [Planctomycetaceae bacterium]|nr:hypothetical protein [Planctomycetaceae bacterium]
MTRLHSAAILCTLILVAGSTLACRRSCEFENIGIDLIQFHQAARHVRSGGNADLYEDSVRQQILSKAWEDARQSPNTRFFHAVNFRHQRSLELYSSPFLYTVFSLMAAMPYENAIKMHHVISLIGTILGCLGFGLCCGIPRTSLIIAAGAMLAFSPLIIDLNVANVNQIQFGMLGVLLLIRYTGRLHQETGKEASSKKGTFSTKLREFLCGLWFALCLCFKPSLLWCAALVIVDAVHRRDRTRLRFAAAGGVTGGALAFSSSLLFFESQHWLRWLRAVSSLPDEIIKTSQGNFSPTYFAVNSLQWPPAVTTVTGPLLCASVATAFWIRARRQQAADCTRDSARAISDARLLVVGVMTYLLTARLVWFHYLVLSIPAILYLIGHIFRTPDRTEQIILSLIVVWTTLLIGLQPPDFWIGSTQEEHMLRCFLANTILLSMVLLCPPRILTAENSVG